MFKRLVYFKDETTLFVLLALSIVVMYVSPVIQPIIMKVKKHSRQPQKLLWIEHLQIKVHVVFYFCVTVSSQ